MATISYVNAVQPAGAATGAAISRATPAALQDNDLLLAVVTHSSALTAVPSGWTLLKSQAYTSLTTTHTISVYRKTTVTSADSAITLDFTQTSSGPWSLGTVAFRAGTQYTISLLEALSTASNNVNTYTGTPSALTSTKAQEMFVFALGTIKGDSTAYASTGPTSATTWTGSSSSTKVQSGSYRAVTGAVTSAGDMVYDSSAVTDNGLGMISMRFYASPAPDTVTDGVSVSEATPVSWNAATTLADSASLSEETWFGFQYLDALTEQVNLSEVSNLGRMVDATDTLEFSEAITPTPVQSEVIAYTIQLVDLAYRNQRFAVAQADGLEIDTVPTGAALPRPTIVDGIGVGTTVQPNTVRTQTIADPVRLADRLLAAVPVTASVSLTLGDVLLTVRGVQVLERLGITLTQAPTLTFGLSAVEALRLRDSLANFFGGDISDGVEFGYAVLPRKRAYPLAADGVELDDALAPKLVLRVDASDDLGLTDDEALKLVFGPTIRDGVQISAAYIEPNGAITTWAVNTRTGATTEYSNFEFNSFAKLGNTYLAASASGLYELVGDTDDGDSIIARIKSGLIQFNGSRYSAFKAAYIGMRADGYIFLKLETGDGKSYTYRSMLQDMQTTKVLLGKGLRARYFSFELITEGQDFDLDTVEFVPMLANRRV